MSLIFTNSADIDIHFTDLEDRKDVDVPIPTSDSSKLERGAVVTERYPLYMDGETISGQVTVRPRNGHPLEHGGIMVQLLRTIEITSAAGKTVHELNSNKKVLAAAGELQHPQTFDFSYRNVDMPDESYTGINAKLLYFVRVTIERRLNRDITSEKRIWVYSYRMPPETNSSIKMDVGIEDCLHIEFEYSRSKYHLKDVIVGRIYFLLVRLKIQRMELSVIRKEITGALPNQDMDNSAIVQFEIMDGSPSRGETIPIRLFLNGFDLTPTFKDVNKKFSVRYYLSLVLIDEDLRRYFKQSEIVLYRQAPEDLVQPQLTQAEIQTA